MTPAIADANDLVRAAVEMRRERQAAGKPVEEWYDVTMPVTEPMPEVSKAEEMQHVTFGYDSETIKAARDFVAAREEFKGVEQQPVTVAEQTLQGAIEAVRDRHTKYGPPREHFTRTAALVNAAFGTNFTPADWALVMVLAPFVWPLVSQGARLVVVSLRSSGFVQPSGRTSSPHRPP